MLLVDPLTRGDPESALRWVTGSTRTVSAQLRAQGHTVSHMSVARLLHQQGFSMQANAKENEGAQHPDRDAQFRFINTSCEQFTATGDPVISVDTKKKEVLADTKTPGQRWEPKEHPTRVDDHDFPDPGKVRAYPYGVYDLDANRGVVNVGISHDTAAFAAASLRTWWQWEGAARYPGATRLLITADSGGSNDRRSRLWKVELARFAADVGISVHVRHFPAGTSKWNKIEHRLFSAISNRMRARPLRDIETMLGVIGAASTRSGLHTTAVLDEGDYPTGIKITAKQVKELPLVREDFHPEWNYRINPKTQ